MDGVKALRKRCPADKPASSPSYAECHKFIGIARNTIDGITSKALSTLVFHRERASRMLPFWLRRKAAMDSSHFRSCDSDTPTWGPGGAGGRHLGPLVLCKTRCPVPCSIPWQAAPLPKLPLREPFRCQTCFRWQTPKGLALSNRAPSISFTVLHAWAGIPISNAERTLLRQYTSAGFSGQVSGSRMASSSTCPSSTCCREVPARGLWIRLFRWFGCVHSFGLSAAGFIVMFTAQAWGTELRTSALATTSRLTALAFRLKFSVDASSRAASDCQQRPLAPHQLCLRRRLLLIRRRSGDEDRQSHDHG